MPPTLTTDRLRLRAARLSDRDAFMELNSDPRVLQYINGGRPLTAEESDADLERRVATANQPLGYWVLEWKSDGTFLGWGALKQLDQTDKIEVGYRLKYEAWGRGVATEAAKALLAYGFTSQSLEVIWGVCMPTNLASRRVLEKIGLTYRGHGLYYATRCSSYSIDRETYLAQTLSD